MSGSRRADSRTSGDSGATVAEYSLAVAFVALALLVALQFLQDRSSDRLSEIDATDDDNALILHIEGGI